MTTDNASEQTPVPDEAETVDSSPQAERLASASASCEDVTIVNPLGPAQPPTVSQLPPGAEPPPSLTQAMPENLRYEIIRQIGEGGMGVVYEARQANPARRVALKMIKAGHTSPNVLRRFEVEADLLGKLKHPGIASIYEAGFSQGRPFFAMEFIDGPTLTTYADTHRLDTRARLELFGQVCDAIHHAHTKGVIHRDLKPANILVTQVGDPPKPQVKVLDFGVARVTESDVQTTTMHTDVGQLVGTIPYMSPEQIAGANEDIDTRSDVYALGVVLYELLSGQLPYDLKQRVIHEAARVICEDAPTRLSGINTKLRGDIETIVGKALEKDRERRYPSANELSADVRRYLDDEPITARPPSRGYLMKKFAQRNKALVAGVAATFVVLVLGIVATSIFAVLADDARARAEAARSAEAEQRAHATQMQQLAQQRALEADESRRAAEYDAYLANLVAAQSALASYNPDAARGYLESCAPGLRNWEWAHLDAGLDGALMVLDGGGGEVSAVAYSPDGSRLATGTRTGVVRLWDARTGAPLATTPSHPSRQPTAGINTLAFSADGSRLVSGTYNGVVTLRDTATGETLATFNHGEQYSSIVLAQLSPDRTRLLVATMTQRVFLWDTQTHEKLGEYLASDDPTHQFVTDRGAFTADFTADGRSFYIVPDRWATTSASATAIRPAPRAFSDARARSRIKVYDTATGELRGEVVCQPGGVSGEARPWLAGEPLVLALSAGQNFFMHDAQADTLTALQGELTDRIDLAQIDPAGRRAVLVSAGQVYLHDIATGQRIAQFPGGRLGTTHAALSPDSSLVAVLSRDNTARLWDADDGSEITALLGHTAAVTAFDFSPDGAYCATGSADGTARVWRARSHARSDRLDQPMLSRGFYRTDAAAYRPDGQAFAYLAEGVVYICDATTGRTLEQYPLDGWAHGSEQLIDLHYAGDTLALITTAPDTDPGGVGGLLFRLNLRDLARGKTYSQTTPLLSASCRISPDGRYVLTANTAGQDLAIHLTDLETGDDRTINAPPGRRWTYADFAPDSQSIAAVANDGRVTVWDMQGQTRFETPPAPQDTDPAKTPTLVILSPDGQHLLVGNPSGELWVYHIDTAKPLRQLAGSQTLGQPIGFPLYAVSPQGDRLAIHGADFRVGLWDIHTGQHLATLDDHTANLKSISFSPDATRVITASDDGTARLWDADTGQNVLLLHRAQGPQLAAHFSPDGQSILTAQANGTVLLWHTRPCHERLPPPPQP
ncbi:MAG: protein kinase [Phycisphaerales bacterium JB063]